MFFTRFEFFSISAVGGQMLRFYKIAVVVALLLILVTGVILYVGESRSRLNVYLLPMQDSKLPWFSETVPDVPVGGTYIKVNEEADIVDFSFLLSSEQAYPYIDYGFIFADYSEPEKVVDISKYNKVTFQVSCTPQNTLWFVLLTHDEILSSPTNPMTRRVSSIVFPCDAEWKTITVYLDELHVPDWWLVESGLGLADRSYNLAKVYAFGIANSLQSPLETISQVKIKNFRVHGENKNYVYASYILTLLCWMGFLFWLFRSYLKVTVADVKEKVRQDRPLLAYKQLSISPHKDETKSAVLRFMATEYANPELTQDLIRSSLGASRARVNGILKEEVGLTFSAYLNKLRLTEAARLLSERSDFSVAEIAYSVGYNNVTYFNRLFKAEYGCSPKTFKALYKDAGPPEPPQDE